MAADPQPSTARDADETGDDPLLSALVERTIAPYRRLLPEPALAELRTLLEGLFTTHPEVAPVVDRLRQLRPPDHSGVRPKRRGGRG